MKRNINQMCVVSSPPVAWWIQQDRRKEMWLEADGCSSNHLSSQSLSDQWQNRTQDWMWLEMFNYQLDHVTLSHKPFLDITMETESACCCCFSHISSSHVHITCIKQFRIIVVKREKKKVTEKSSELIKNDLIMPLWWLFYGFIWAEIMKNKNISISLWNWSQEIQR